jgi:hypothetical protein
MSLGNMLLMSLFPMMFTGIFLFLTTRIKDSAEISVFIALIGGLITGQWITFFNVPPQEDERYD